MTLSPVVYVLSENGVYYVYGRELWIPCVLAMQLGAIYKYSGRAEMTGLCIVRMMMMMWMTMMMMCV
jgi:hypothetical protein